MINPQKSRKRETGEQKTHEAKTQPANDGIKTNCIIKYIKYTWKGESLILERDKNEVEIYTVCRCCTLNIKTQIDRSKTLQKKCRHLSDKADYEARISTRAK